MSNIKEQLALFIENYRGEMSRELAVAVVNEYGGMQKFLNKHEAVCNEGIQIGLVGWATTDEAVRFYNANKTLILQFAESESQIFEYEDAVDMITSFECFNRELSHSEIKDAIHNEASINHEKLAINLALYTAEQLARACEQFTLNNDILKQVI